MRMLPARRTIFFLAAIVCMTAGSWAAFRQAETSARQAKEAVCTPAAAPVSGTRAEGSLMPDAPAPVIDQHMEAKWSLFAWVCAGAALLTAVLFWITIRNSEHTLEHWTPRE